MNVRKWPTGDVRRVSVNNFGFGGSNAHVVIEDARGYRESQDLIGRYPYHSQTMQSQRIPGMMDGEAQIDQEDQPRIFLLSSFDELSGKRQVQNLRRYLKARQDGYSACFMRDLAYTLNERRSSLPWKQAFTANSVSKLIEALNDGEVKFTKTTKAKNIGFVFTGQGASWHAMGRDLIAEHLVFRKSLDLADQHLQALGATWSLYGE